MGNRKTSKSHNKSDEAKHRLNLCLLISISQSSNKKSLEMEAFNEQ